MKQQLCIRLTEATREALARAAQEELRSLSSVVEIATRDWLAQRDYIDRCKPRDTKRAAR